MAFGWPRMKVSPIAIDFGSEWLKLLQVVPGNPPQLVAAAAAQVPEAARHDPIERHRFLGEALRDALRRQPFKGRRAICSLPAYQTLAQNFEIARTDADDMPARVADQLRQRLNVDPARMVIRHYDLGQMARHGSTFHHVLCLAAGRDVVMHYIDLCSQCKLDVVGMHSEPAAILHAFAHLNASHNGSSEKAVCYIDLGSTTTKLTIAHGSTIVFAKTIQADASRLIPPTAQAHEYAAAEAAGSPASAAQARQADQASAEGQAGPLGTPSPTAGSGLALLDAATGHTDANTSGGEGHGSEGGGDHGGDGGGGSSSSSSGGGVAAQGHAFAVDKPADDTLECLIDELQMCLRYHQGLFPQQSVERLVFFGGAARHVQTCQRIAQSVRVAAQLGDPLAQLVRVSAQKPPVGVDFDQPQPGWAVPFGLTSSEANL